MDPQIWSSSSKAGSPDTGELLTEIYLPDVQSCTQALCPHSSAENISCSCWSWLCLVLSFLRDTISHTSGDFQRSAPIPGSKERRSRSARAVCTDTFVEKLPTTFHKGGLKMWGMSELLYLRALQTLSPEEKTRKKGREKQEGRAAKGPGGEGWEGEGRQRGSMTEPPGRPSVGSNRGQSHQTGLPRFQSLLTFVNHQPVSLHRRALPAVTPSTQTGWQQLLCLKEGLWISQH